jgi:hypothetical protein
MPTGIASVSPETPSQEAGRFCFERRFSMLTGWFMATAVIFTGLRILTWFFGKTDQQNGWKMYDTTALVCALLAIASAV